MAQSLNRIGAGVLSANDLNANVNSNELQATQQLGVGVISGLAVTVSSGLTLAFASGVLQSRMMVACPGFTAAIPDNATSYLYIDFSYSTYDGSGNPVWVFTLHYSGSYSVPSGMVPVGKAVTSGGVITSITTEGRIELARQVGSQFKIGQSRVVVDDSDGSVTLSGSKAVIASPIGSTPMALQTLSGNGQTLTLPTAGISKRLTDGGSNRTGTILTAGTIDGQMLTLINIGSNSITFAASGTSHVADGTSAVLAALRSMTLTWDAGSSLWYRS